MPVKSIGEYPALVRDNVENFHGNQLVFVGWDHHLMIDSPRAFPLPADMPFADQRSERHVGRQWKGSRRVDHQVMIPADENQLVTVKIFHVVPHPGRIFSNRFYRHVVSPLFKVVDLRGVVFRYQQALPFLPTLFFRRTDVIHVVDTQFEAVPGEHVFKISAAAIALENLLYR